VSRKPGFYWIRWTTADDWQPARWSGRRWTFIGLEQHGTGDPREVGDRLKPPATRTRHCKLCGRAEGDTHKLKHEPRYE
jgi:hypothetical protein